MFDFPNAALPGFWTALYPAMVWLYGLLNVVSAVCLITLLVGRLSHAPTWLRVAVLFVLIGRLGNTVAVLASVGFTVSATNMATEVGIACIAMGFALRANGWAKQRQVRRVQVPTGERQRV